LIRIRPPARPSLGRTEIGGPRRVVQQLLLVLLEAAPPLRAPDIVEAILDGRQPKGMQLEDLTRPMPSGWEEQRAAALKG